MQRERSAMLEGSAGEAKRAGGCAVRRDLAKELDRYLLLVADCKKGGVAETAVAQLRTFVRDLINAMLRFFSSH
jgi:hypothetical protein